MELPALLLETYERLRVALSSRNVVEYSFIEGDYCCDDHNEPYEWYDEAGEAAAAQRLSYAWAVALSAPGSVSADLSVEDTMSSLLQGLDLPDSLTASAEQTAVWLQAAGPPDPEALRVALTESLRSGSERLVVPVASDVVGAWSTWEPGLQGEPLWFLDLTSAGIDAIVSEALQ